MENAGIAPLHGSCFYPFSHRGGYYSYHFGGKQGENPLDYDNIYKWHEMGLTYGIGMEAMNVQLGLYYQTGFTNLLQDTEGIMVTNQNFYVMLGIKF